METARHLSIHTENIKEHFVQNFKLNPLFMLHLQRHALLPVSMMRLKRMIERALVMIENVDDVLASFKCFVSCLRMKWQIASREVDRLFARNYAMEEEDNDDECTVGGTSHESHDQTCLSAIPISVVNNNSNSNNNNNNNDINNNKNNCNK